MQDMQCRVLERVEKKERKERLERLREIIGLECLENAEKLGRWKERIPVDKR